MVEAVLSDDVFANLKDINHTSSSEYASDARVTIKSVWYTITEVSELLFGLANIAANLFLIIMILRYKRLRTRMNMYLLNIAITTIVFNFVMPLAYLIIILAHFRMTHSLCACFWIEEGACFVMYFLACILAVDWYLVNYKKNFVQLHQKLYKFIIGIIYLIGVIRFIVLAVLSCGYDIRGVHHLLSLTYLLVLVVAIVVNFLRVRQLPNNEIQKTRYALIASNVIIFSWLPMFVFDYLFNIDSIILRRVLFTIDIIPRLMTQANTIFLLYVLGKTNRNFQTAYSRAFRKNVRDYEQDDLDIESGDDEAIIEHHVDIDTKPLTAGSGNSSLF